MKQYSIDRRLRTKEELDAAKYEYHYQCIPIRRSLMELDQMFPRSFTLNEDGTFKEWVDYGWPKWAIDQKERLENAMLELRNKIIERRFPVEGW